MTIEDFVTHLADKAKAASGKAHAVTVELRVSMDSNGYKDTRCLATMLCDGAYFQHSSARHLNELDKEVDQWLEKTYQTAE
jgi:hypothetical protein